MTDGNKCSRQALGLYNISEAARAVGAKPRQLDYAIRAGLLPGPTFAFCDRTHYTAEAFEELKSLVENGHRGLGRDE